MTAIPPRQLTAAILIATACCVALFTRRAVIQASDSLNTTAAQAARKQGGLVSYAHPISAGLYDVFDTNLGGKEIPVMAALGALDAIDVLPFGPPAYELW